jgi:hypothetical protein
VCGGLGQSLLRDCPSCLEPCIDDGSVKRWPSGAVQLASFLAWLVCFCFVGSE